jgi:hypothetical protein
LESTRRRISQCIEKRFFTGSSKRSCPRDSALMESLAFPPNLSQHLVTCNWPKVIESFAACLVASRPAPLPKLVLVSSASICRTDSCRDCSHGARKKSPKHRQHPWSCIRGAPNPWASRQHSLSSTQILRTWPELKDRTKNLRRFRSTNATLGPQRGSVANQK